jgi:spore germination cell wall hydrolase CwlJ-like protein
MTAISLSPARQKAVKLWRDYPREVVALGGLALAAVIAVAGSAWSNPSAQVASHSAAVAPPAPPPMVNENVAPDQALAVNAKTPFASGPNPPALPFDASKLSATARARAIDCLASAEYYEAGDQGDDGERAVAQVVLNRVRHPAFPSSICGVVYEGSTKSTGCQFTFTCDGSLERRPDAQGWAKARAIAEEALNGAVYAPVGWATHYHADYVLPVWAGTMAKNAIVGAHLFYRWPGAWGQPAAFSQHYARQEPDSAALRVAALASFASRPATSAAQQIANLPGAEMMKAPAGRIAMRFNLPAARKAAEDAPHEDYSKQFDASANLKWALSGDAPAAQTPLGQRATQAPGDGTP